MNYGVRATDGGRRMARELRTSAHVPYTVHLDEHTVCLRDGSLMQVVAVEGFRFETESFDVLQHNVDAFNTLLKGQQHDTYLYATLVRRKERAIPGGSFPSGFSRDLNERWMRRYASDDIFVNELYLSVIRADVSIVSGGMRNLIDTFWSDRTVRESAHERERMRLELSETVQTFMNLMRDFGTRRLGMVRRCDADGTAYRASEILEFVSKVLERDGAPRALPARPLNEAVCRRRVYFKHRTVIQEGVSALDTTYGAILSLTDYAGTTYSGMLNGLLAVPHELIVTQSFVPVAHELARKELAKLHRILTVTGEHQDVRDNVQEALGDLAMGKVAFGTHHLTVMVADRTPDELEHTVATITPVFSNVGATVRREDLNLEAAYWAQVPGNVAYIARGSLVSTRNIAGLASFHNYARGNPEGGHLKPALTVVSTPGETPYYLNLHIGKNGHTCIFGPTGSGKTTFAAFLISQSQKYGGKTIVIDKDRSWELYVRADCGTYVTIEPGRPTNLNPLRLPDTPANRRYVAGLVELIIERELGVALSRSERTPIESAVHALYDEFRPEERRFALLHQLLNHKTLMDALHPWVEGQQHGWVFDNRDDTLTFDAAITGIDVGWMLDDTTVRAPLMSYLMHRMQEVIDSRDLTRVVLEEGWKLIRDPELQVRIEDWMRTVRKKNAFVVFCSQDPELGSKVGKAIYDQSATQIFFPHFSADRDVYCKQLGLTETQYGIVKHTPMHTRHAFVRHGDEAVVIVFDLSSLPGDLAILAGTTETVHTMHELQREYGDEPSHWLPHFLKEVRHEE